MNLQRFLLVIFLHAGSIDALTLQTISWNVLSNNWMDNGFDIKSLEVLLNSQNFMNGTKEADIVAISIQENCYKCNEGNREELINVFRNVLNSMSHSTYQIIGSEATRAHNVCEGFFCRNIHHGTTVSILLAQKDVVSLIGTHKVNYCSGGFIKNAEKGIAGIEVKVKASGEHLCFAGLHLDSSDSQERRQCVEDFWSSRPHDKWQNCDVIIMAGDFNTRTGPKSDIATSSISAGELGSEYFEQLSTHDEMCGQSPYGGVSMLSHLTKTTGHNFNEAEVRFLPTYSVRHDGDCNGKRPCYRHNRRPSWTDRIVCSGCKEISLYESKLFAKSDHNPVIAIMEI